MPDTRSTPRRTPEQPPSDELVLAAVERAVRHRASEQALAVPLWSVLAHLHVAARSTTARRVSARLAALTAAGLLERSRRHGVATWQLTVRGRRRLAALRSRGALDALPESPQHRAWRQARTAAEQEIARFERDLYAQLERARQLSQARAPAPSDAWFELGEELRAACRRFASASYCLREWQEPDDATPDRDTRTDTGEERLPARERERRRALRAGRRNVRLWDERA